MSKGGPGGSSPEERSDEDQAAAPPRREGTVRRTGPSRKRKEQDALTITDLTFDDRGLIPAVVQDEGTRDVLMVAWMNEEALRRTLDEGRTVFWSRSRGELWRKGETSGNLQHVREVRYDCDADTLLVLVHQDGVACHTGSRTCFYRRLEA